MIEVSSSSVKRWAQQVVHMKKVYYVAFLTLVAMVAFLLVFSNHVQAQTEGKRLITVYDRNTESSFLTTKTTIKAALSEHGIELDPRDTVEPSRDEELVADDYQVNIYRARPVFVIDGSTRVKVMTPYQVPERIAKDAGVTIYPEDNTPLTPSDDFVGDGAGLQMTIDRATQITVELYGVLTPLRTQAETVGELLKEKNIVLGENGRVSVLESTAIFADMQFRVWREGVQTITADVPVPFGTERVQDADRPIGYKVISRPGVAGANSVTYQIEVKDGVEISRIKIASVPKVLPVSQVEIIGIKPNANALTKAKGAHIFTDSNGVRHRETYYDLNMSRVMQACGQGGFYSVRADGIKVDRDGYAIIAANYNRYPRCSVVETSVGPGKVYDTGGFALNHPDGFDLATDWSQADGR
jgi:uncharacterized protein YabE (DUF348 family)